MGKGVRVAAALVVCLLIVAGCGFGSGPPGLPDVPDDTGRPAAVGAITDQPPLAPITFSIEYGGEIAVVDTSSLVTHLAKVTVSGNSVTNRAGQPVQPEPAGATQLIICPVGSTEQSCDAYRIDSGRPIRIEPRNGILVEERNRVIIQAAPGSTVSVTDDGSPTAPPPPYGPGPARIDVKQFDFQEASRQTEVNLERSGTAADLSYDHFSGELKPTIGASVFLYDKGDWWFETPSERNDYPGEQECRNNRNKDNLFQKWQGAFSKEDLGGNEFSTFCIMTVEGHVGLLFIEADESKKPIAYNVYSHIWVR